MKMRAAVLYEQNEPLLVEEIELDPPKAGELLVKMVATGVCHSDAHYYTGDSQRMSDRPVILGHEGAGIVEEVGPGVTIVKPGDHVIMTFLPACGKCKWCHRGEPTLCDLGALIRTGKMLDGTSRHHRASDGADIDNFLFVSSFAEYTVTAEASIVKVPDYLPLERLCLLGCGFTTGYGAVTNAVHIRPGETVTIVGCGGLGLAAIQGARSCDAGKIIAVDIHEEKLAMAKKFGATHTILNRHDVREVTKEIREITWGEGTDYSFEFVGMEQSQETQAIAFKAARKAGTVVLVGAGVQKLKEKTLPISSDELILYRKTIKGVLFGDAQFQIDIPRYVDLFEQGKINLDDMVTKEFTLDDINTCFENVLAGNRVARQVIRF
ncbi:MAG: Zn-dependent alcohol dehydrogenase [SAR324 cluster bacterium]|nr:Zn-dependent alcohol dehydrogenase [SAR324 cluster bacterium]